MGWDGGHVQVTNRTDERLDVKVMAWGVDGGPTVWRWDAGECLYRASFQTLEWHSIGILVYLPKV